jgi:hypothetical protein
MLINFRVVVVDVVVIDVMLTDIDIITIYFIRSIRDNPEYVDTNLGLSP